MSVNYNPAIVTNGLILYLDAANRRSYPNSGTTWFDLSGNNYRHNLVNAPLVTIDNVLCFDVSAAGRYIVDSGVTFTFGSSHTMISWARSLADSQVNTWRTLWRTQLDDHPLLIQDSTNTIGYYDNNVAQFVSYGLNIGTLGLENKWTMFSLVASGGKTTLYINDGLINASVNYTTSGNSHDAIGSTNGGSQPFGYVSTAKVYDRALTVTEIIQIFNATRGRFGI